MDVDLSRPVVEAAAKHPELKIMIGFSRRCKSSFAIYVHGDAMLMGSLQSMFPTERQRGGLMMAAWANLT